MPFVGHTDACETDPTPSDRYGLVYFRSPLIAANARIWGLPNYAVSSRLSSNEPPRFTACIHHLPDHFPRRDTRRQRRQYGWSSDKTTPSNRRQRLLINLFIDCAPVDFFTFIGRHYFAINSTPLNTVGRLVLDVNSMTIFPSCDVAR